MANGNDNTTDVMNPPAPSAVTPPSAAPNLPAPAPAVATLAPQPAAQPAAPAPAAQPHPLARALDAVLKSATGGDAFYTDPETGERKLAPQSRGTLGKTLIAATLAGMLAPDKYRETPFGPVRDYTGTAGSAMQASQAALEKARQRPQQLSEQQMAAKLRVIENATRAYALHTAQWHFKQDQYAVNKPTIDATNNALQEYENSRDANDPNQPSAWLQRGLTVDQLTKNGFRRDEANVYQDGRTPDGEPTYAIINPKLQNITLTPEQTDLLARVNSQYRNIHAVVGGKVTIPMSTFISGMQDVAMVNSGRGWINQLNHNDSVNGGEAKDITQEQFEDAIRKNPKMLKVMWGLTHAGASGNLPDQRADNLLDVLATQPGGEGVLALMGLTPQEAMAKAEDINRERESKEALAKMGGIGPKAPALPESIQKTQDTITNNKDLTDTQRTTLLNRFPAPGPDGQVHMTQGQLKDVDQAMQAFMTAHEKEALQTGDPKVLAASVNNMVFGGDIAKIQDLIGYARNNPTLKLQYANALHDAAQAAGLDPNNFTMGAFQAKNDMLQDYSGGSKTKTGQQIIAFDTLLGHIQDAYKANNDWVRSNNPYMAKAQSWWARNMSNDPDYLRFQDDIIAPAKEYMNFLNANRAEHTEDIASLQRVLDPSTSPRAATQAMESFLRTADVRAAAIGHKYIETMGKTYPVVDGQSAALLNGILGGRSHAVAVSTPIPRGWVGASGEVPKRSMPSNQVLETILAAAGNDKALAMRLANENGWVIPQ